MTNFFFLKFIIQWNTRQKPTNSLNYLGFGGRWVAGWVQDEWLGELREGCWNRKGRDEQTGWRDDRWRGGIKLYKTHLSLSTMEKVKAHDRYKHICYWVVQLLYFDGLESVISTQVGSFDSMCVRVLHLFYSTVAWLSLCKCTTSCTSTKPINPHERMLKQLQVLWLWRCRAQSGIASCMVCCWEGSVLSNESTHFWGHTRGRLGII